MICTAPFAVADGWVVNDQVPQREDTDARPGVAPNWSKDGGQLWKGELLLLDPKRYRFREID